MDRAVAKQLIIQNKLEKQQKEKVIFNKNFILTFECIV